MIKQLRKLVIVLMVALVLAPNVKADQNKLAVYSYNTGLAKVKGFYPVVPNYSERLKKQIQVIGDELRSKKESGIHFVFAAQEVMGNDAYNLYQNMAEGLEAYISLTDVKERGLVIITDLLPYSQDQSDKFQLTEAYHPFSEDIKAAAGFIQGRRGLLHFKIEADDGRILNIFNSHFHFKGKGEQLDSIQAQQIKDYFKYMNNPKILESDSAVLSLGDFSLAPTLIDPNSVTKTDEREIVRSFLSEAWDDFSDESKKLDFSLALPDNGLTVDFDKNPSLREKTIEMSVLKSDEEEFSGNFDLIFYRDGPMPGQYFRLITKELAFTDLVEVEKVVVVSKGKTEMSDSFLSDHFAAFALFENLF